MAATFLGMTSERQAAAARRIFRYSVLAFLMLWPWYGDTFVLLGDADLALLYAIVAFSLVLLTGWVGQISLAQAAFVGIGAFSTALLVDGLHVGFPVSLLVGGGAAALAAVALGAVALRVRGLYLAVTTLIFAWMCDTYLFLTPWLGGGGGAVQVPTKTVGTPEGFPFFEFTNRRTFYYVALGVAALVFFALSNLRDSKSGRAFFAVKGSEVAAASLGVDVTRYKLLAFGLSGFVAGMAGSLYAVHQGALTAGQFRFTFSLFYLAIAVVGGLQSLGGSVAAAILFGALSDVFFRYQALNGYLDLVSGLLLGAVLLAYPGGLAAAPGDFARFVGRAREARRARAPATEEVEPTEFEPEEVAVDDEGAPARRRGLRRVLRGAEDEPPPEDRLLPLSHLGIGGEAEARAEPVAVDDASGLALSLLDGGDGARRPARRASRRRATPVLEAQGVTVRFGGLTAVDDVSLKVCEGEITGLIGPNGAGKTTMFNAIAGLNRPAAGTVRIFGADATALPVHARARLGVARTFQAIQLFKELTVRDNLLVATHLQNPTGFLAHIAATGKALEYEDQCRLLVRRVLELADLEDVADRPVEGLPFGTLRMVEVARALVTRAPFIMLDEPASGLDNAETDRLIGALFALREQLGVTILLIEHDVRMVTTVCDYMYVVDRGKLIAEGPTERVQRDPAVIAAYLGKPLDAPDAAPAELVEVGS